MATCGGPVLWWRNHVGWAVVGVEVRCGQRHAVGSGVEAGDRQRRIVGHDVTWGGKLDTRGPVGCVVVESDATWGPSRIRGGRLDARWWSRGTGRGRPVQVAGGSFEVWWVVLMRGRIVVPGPSGRWSSAGDMWHRGSPGWVVEGIRGGLRQIREQVGPESMKKNRKKEKNKVYEPR